MINIPFTQPQIWQLALANKLSSFPPTLAWLSQSRPCSISDPSASVYLRVVVLVFPLRNQGDQPELDTIGWKRDRQVPQLIKVLLVIFLGGGYQKNQAFVIS